MTTVNFYFQTTRKLHKPYFVDNKSVTKYRRYDEVNNKHTFNDKCLLFQDGRWPICKSSGKHVRDGYVASREIKL